MEYWIVGRMLKQGLDVYLPLVDDHAIDAVIKRPDGSFVEVQIKARSETAKHCALFAAITHELRSNYWFVFYSEQLDTTWVMSSEEFIAEAAQNKSGVHAGKRGLWLNGTKTDKATGECVPYAKERYSKYVCEDFSRLSQPVAKLQEPAKEE